MLILLIAYGIWLFVTFSRTYLPFIICSYGFAFIVYKLRGEKFLKLFDKAVWLHKTSLNEALVIIIGYVFFAMVIQKSYLFYPDTYRVILEHIFSYFGLPAVTKEPTILAGMLFIICFILAFEAAYYLAHRWMHSNKYLWEFHKVHHSAEVMTPFTSFRQHPVEFILNAISRALFLGTTAAVFIYFFPSPESMIFVIQSQLAMSVFLMLGGSLAHSHAWISYGKLDQFVISPAMHQIHHSTNPKHFDKNFGFMLICFDRWFGTAYIPQKRENLSYGLGEEENKKFHDLNGVFLKPFLRAWRKRTPNPVSDTEDRTFNK